MPTANITIKRKTGSSEYTELYPTTIISQVTGLQTALDSKVNTSIVGQPSGLATLDGTGKIPVAQLPNTVFDSLEFFSVVGQNSDLRQLAVDAYEATRPIYTTEPRNIKGLYWVASANITLTAPAGSIFYNDPFSTLDPYFVAAVLLPSEEGKTTDNTSVTIETGDWIVITKVTGDGSNNNPFAVTFGVINNTYELAGTSNTGIVRLSASTSTATTGTDVVTNSVLNSLLATANTNLSGTTNENKLAPAAHHHDSLYLGIGANATTASQWSTARTVTFATGTVTGSFSINGSADVGNVALTYTGNEFYYTTAESNINDLIFETDPA
jgi:hypothetical protein